MNRSRIASLIVLATPLSYLVGVSPVVATAATPTVALKHVTAMVKTAPATIHLPQKKAAKTSTGVRCTIWGNGGNNKLKGTEGDDVICGLGGNDTIDGRGGNDIIDAGSGNDKVKGGAGNDTLIGGSGNDALDGGAGDDTASFADVTSSKKKVTVNLGKTGKQKTGDGTDKIVGSENLIGGAGSDTLTGTDAPNAITGGKGNDKIIAGGGDDTVEGGAGNDKVYSGNGNDFVDAGSGNDAVVGGDGDDGLIGGSGADNLNGDGGTAGDSEHNLCDPKSASDVVSYCGFDEDSPDISDITVDRTSVDTSSSAQTVTISARATDQLMGVNLFSCWLTQSGTYVAGQTGKRGSGTARDGVWSCQVTLPASSSPGAWYVTVGALDHTGKQTQVQGQADETFSYWKAGSMSETRAGLGVSQITQTGTGDTGSPDISDIMVDRTSVDTSSAAQTVTITARVTDDLSGTNSFSCSLAQSGTNVAGQGRTRQSGTSRDGVWTCEVTLPLGSSRGAWYVIVGALDNTGKQTQVQGQADGTFNYWKAGSMSETRTGLGVAYVTNG